MTYTLPLSNEIGLTSIGEEHGPKSQKLLVKWPTLLELLKTGLRSIEWNASCRTLVVVTAMTVKQLVCS